MSDASGRLNVEPVEARPLTQALLDTNDAFILDTGSAGIFAWVGKGATKEEKCASMTNATNFISQKGYPNWTPVTRVVEGGETPLFKQNFQASDDTCYLQFPEYPILSPLPFPRLAACQYSYKLTLTTIVATACHCTELEGA